MESRPQALGPPPSKSWPQASKHLEQRVSFAGTSAELRVLWGDSVQGLLIGPYVVPFYGLYLESCKVTPKKELLRGLWVGFLQPLGMLMGTTTTTTMGMNDAAGAHADADDGDEGDKDGSDIFRDWRSEFQAWAKHGN